MRVGRILCLTVGALISQSSVTLATNSVVVESKDVLPGAVGATLEISIANDVSLSFVVIPLVCRSVSGGAFWTNVPASLDTLPWHGRIAAGVLDGRVFNKSDVDGSSPEKMMIAGYRSLGSCLGSGPLQGMLAVKFDVNNSLGQFEIDTTLVSPANHLIFVDCISSTSITPSFTKGTVTITGETSAANSVVVESKDVLPGAVGATIEISIANDDSLSAVVIPLVCRSVSGGAFWTNVPASLDTLPWHGRMAAGTLGLRVFNKLDVDGSSPDKIMIVGYRTTGSCLGSGPLQGMLAIKFDVNSSPGQFEIDTTLVPPANHLVFVNCISSSSIVPSFTKGTVTITDQLRLVSVESKQVPLGSTDVSLEISVGNSVDLSGFTLPLVARSLSGGAFWTNVAASLDTLPWHGRLSNALTGGRILDRSAADGVSPDPVLLRAFRTSDPCLSAGPLQGMITLTFDVNNSDGQFIIDTAFIAPGYRPQFENCVGGLTPTPTFVPGVVTMTTLDHSLERVHVRTGGGGGDVIYSIAAEDFDGDENLDFVFGSWSMGAGVCFGDGHGGFTPPSFIESSYSYVVGVAFVNSDPLPDIISGSSDGQIHVYLSQGDRTFSPAIVTPTGSADYWLSLTTGYINGDQYVDLVTAFRSSGLPAQVFLGNANGTFTSVGSPFSGFTVNSVGLADMNNDGYTDAITGGTKAAIFRGDGTGNFTLLDSVSIGVTYNVQSSYRGNIVDFNRDGHADFVTTYPPVGVSNYHARVFLGDGTGHIASQVVLPLDGISYPVAVLDYNYDGLLDVAVGSSQMEWIYIFQGDGAGGFTHTLSLVISPEWPASMIVGDFRQDGRWDFIEGSPDGSVSAFLNTAPPLPVLDSQMVTSGLNDVQLRVTSPPGLAVSNLGNSIAGARIGNRDADSNAVLDQQITDLNLQTGEYFISVWRVPNANPNSHYTLGIGINGHTAQRRFAVNASLPPPGDTFHFSFPYGAALAVEPPTGTFVGSTQPTFDWSALAASSKQAVGYEFALDDYWDFVSPEIRDTNLTEPRFTPPTPLLNDTLYYWRFRAFDGAVWGPYSAVYVVNTLPPCDCPHQGDLAQNGVIDVNDVLALIRVAFLNGADVQDPICPRTRADVNNDGVVNVNDVLYLIKTAFINGPDPIDPCL